MSLGVEPDEAAMAAAMSSGNLQIIKLFLLAGLSRLEFSFAFG